MRSILLIGGGGHCRSCIDVIETTKRFRVDGVIEARECSDRILGYPVIGSDGDLPNLLNDSSSVLVTVGQINTSETRIRLFDLLKRLNADLPVVASPIAYVSKHSFVGEGTIIMHGAIINCGVRVGKNCIVNTCALIEHDVQINDHCHISTGALINGGVTIGRGSFVGSGAVIKQGVSIGEYVVIGAGQIVLSDVPARTVMKHE